MVARYAYDAWGNHKVFNPDGTENTSASFIGNINPIRYRGYYFDVETGLYYLMTRYYDPQVGRFISPDSIEYLDPSSVSGLNLYAYCNNNPVMYTDESGEGILTAILIGALIGVIIGGTINGVNAYNEGQRDLGLFGSIVGGAIMGGAMGATLALGGAAGLGFVSIGTGLSVAAGVGVGAGLVSYSFENSLRSDREWTVSNFLLSGLSGGVKGLVTFGIGFAGGKLGAFDKMLLKPMLEEASTISKGITYDIAKGIMATLNPNPVKTFLSWSSYYIGETLTKTLFVSSIAAGSRGIIDKIFALFE